MAKNQNTLIWVAAAGIAGVYLLTRQRSTVLPVGVPTAGTSLHPVSASNTPSIFNSITKLFGGSVAKNLPGSSAQSSSGNTDNSGSLMQLPDVNYDSYGNAQGSPFYGLEPDPGASLTNDQASSALTDSISSLDNSYQQD